MKTLKIAKIVLVVGVIATLLLPNLCLAMEPAINNVTEQIQEEKENEVSTEEQNTNNEEQNIITQENITEPEVSVTPEEEQETEGPTEEPMKDNEEVQAEAISLTSLEKAVEEGPKEIQVYAGDGTLQRAINEANPGDVLVLFGGNYNYTSRKTPININKSITIKATGNMPYIYSEIHITDEDENKNDVILEGFSSGMFRIEDGFDYLEVQKPVNLTIKNVTFRGVGGTAGKESSLIDLGKDTDGSVLNIENSLLEGYYDGIRVKSSNNEININSSTLSGVIGLKLEDGEDNTINITNGSSMEVHSSLSREDEAILIAGQTNLKINVDNSKITGLDAAGSSAAVQTKLFSIDDSGATHSKNVAIKIKGTSEIIEKNTTEGSCIFNFGPSNEPEDNNTVYVESSVKLPSQNVSEKYNNTDDKNYVVVGIYDRYENDEFGNLEVKTYEKNELLKKVQSYVPEEKEGHRFDKWMCMDNTDTTKDFEEPYQAETNMDVFPKYVETVKVQIGEKSYTIDKGASLNDLEEPQKEEAKSELTKLKEGLASQGKTFKKFVNSKTGESLSNSAQTAVEDVMAYNILDNAEIIAGYDIMLTVGEETITFENAKTLKELMDEYENIKTAVNKLKDTKDKRFDGFKNQSNDPVNEGTLIDKDTVLTPKYVVDVTIKKSKDDEGQKFTIEENQKLTDLKQDEDAKKLLQEINGVTEKQFKQFVDQDGIEISDDTPIQKHTTLTAKYTVDVTIKKTKDDSEGKTYTLEEGKTLADLTEAQKSEWREYIKSENKEFVWFNEEEIPDENTPIYKNVILTPKYNVVVTIKAVDGDKYFTIEEGKKLADIEEKDEFNKTKEKEGREFSRFVTTKDGSETTFGEGTVINEDITLTPKFKVTVKINDIDGNSLKTVKLEERETLGTQQTELNDIETKTDKTFLGYFENDNKLEKTTPIEDNKTLVAKYTVEVVINNAKGDNLKTITLEEGQTLASKSDELTNIENPADKIFDGYYDENTKIETSAKMRTNKILVAKYNVKVTVNDMKNNKLAEVVMEEGQTLASKSDELANVENPENKIFVGYYEGDSKVGTAAPIETNKTLVAKYNVTVQIGEKTYTVAEGTTLEQLKVSNPEIEQELEDIKDANKEFLGYVDENGNTVDGNIIFNVNTKILPKYKDAEVLEPTTPTPQTPTPQENSSDTVAQASNPKTSDYIMNFIILALISLVGIVISIKLYKKDNK